MTGKYKVTKRVWADHPDGYKVLAHLPGEEIPHERAVKLGLVKGKAESEDDGADEIVTAEDESEDDGADDVRTAEVRRKPRKRTSAKANG